MVEMEYEKKLGSTTPTGSIFALKNFGWSDKSQVDNTSSDGSMSPDKQLSGDELEKELIKRGLKLPFSDDPN